jgi:murein DD-endopeptidase MepM/ murein hydrolase activator NlpD
MKEVPVIKLSSLKAQPLSKEGVRHYDVKKTPRPYERTKLVRAKKSDKNQKPFYKKVMVQCGICVIVCVMVLIMSNIDWDVTNKASEGLNMALEHETDWNIFKGLGENREVVSKKGNRLLYPVNGKVLTEFDAKDKEKTGIMIATTDMVVSASADGEVFYVDNTSETTPYIRIRHNGNFETVYIGVVSDLKVGDEVKATQVLGRALSSQVGYMVMYNSKAVNPVDYLENRED